MIRLRLRGRPPARLSLAGILPERLRTLSPREIGALALDGRRAGTLGEWFEISIEGEPSDRLVIADSGDRLDRVGAGMREGEIRVEGDVGAYAGLGMSGGRLTVEGSAGHGTAVAMAGGELRVAGSVGAELAGALPGENGGMHGGLVVVGGSAGPRAGDRMRRGTLLVAGDVGPFCALRLGAGTIVIGGAPGAHPGVGMRRGSLLCLGTPPALPASFAESGVHELVFARLLARALVGTALAGRAPGLNRLRRWVGDAATGGRGEILAPA